MEVVEWWNIIEFQALTFRQSQNGQPKEELRRAVDAIWSHDY